MNGKTEKKTDNWGRTMIANFLIGQGTEKKKKKKKTNFFLSMYNHRINTEICDSKHQNIKNSSTHTKIIAGTEASYTQVTTQFSNIFSSNVSRNIWLFQADRGTYMMMNIVRLLLWKLHKFSWCVCVINFLIFTSSFHVFTSLSFICLGRMVAPKSALFWHYLRCYV